MQFEFEAELYPWHSDKTTWVFVSLPHDVSDAVDDATSMTGGFGSVKVMVSLGGSQWSTSLFPSKEQSTYVLPIKKAIRTAEGIDVGQTGAFTIDLVHA